MECSGPLLGHTFYFTQCGLLRFKSSSKSRNKDGVVGRGSWRESAVSCKATISEQAITVNSSNRVNIRWWWNGCFYKKKYSVKFRGSAPPASSEQLHMFLFQFSRIHSFPIKFLAFNRTHSAQLEIHLALKLKMSLRVLFSKKSGLWLQEKNVSYREDIDSFGSSKCISGWKLKPWAHAFISFTLLSTVTANIQSCFIP